MSLVAAPWSASLLAAFLASPGPQDGAGATVSAEVPTWESLSAHETPAWFEDAKFGIFIHWGVYSVPSFCDTSTYSEWYQHWLDTSSHGGKVRDFHHRWFGEDFAYRDFAPMFRAEFFDAAEWAEIFRRAGARYVVLTSKHHDGFCLWPSEIASEVRGYPWNAVATGPHRDLVGELLAACRAAGVHPGLYYSFLEWHDPLFEKDLPAYVDQVMIPQIHDLITRYQPEVFWPDGEWDHPDTTWRSTEILDWIYRHATDPSQVVVNDRWGQGLRGQVGDFSTTEYGSLGNSSGKGMRTQRPFEECRGIGHSFALNRAEGYDIYASRERCVRMLVDLVSKGGNLLLDIGPEADGRIPLIMVDRLLAIGRWLEVNGEAIYGTTRGALQNLPFGRSTTKGSKLYLHVFDWPADDVLRVPGLENRVLGARMLGDRVPNRPLPVSRTDAAGLEVSLAGLHPFDPVSVIELELDGPPVVDLSIHADSAGVLHATAEQAELADGSLRLESKGEGGAQSLGFWMDTRSTASWTLRTKPGRSYRLELETAVDPAAVGGVLEITLGDRTQPFPIEKGTGGWANFEWRPFGTWSSDSQNAILRLRAKEVGPVALLNLRALRLVPLDPHVP